MALSKGFTTRRSLLVAIRDSANDQAWREFLAIYEPMILSWCRRSGLGRCDAEDVCAEVIGKLVPVMRDFPYDPQQRFRGWLRTVVGHAVADFWRHRRRQPLTVSLGDAPAGFREVNLSPPPGFEDVAEAMEESLEEAMRIAEAVRRRVQESVWQAFWLTTVKGEKAREVAGKLGMSVAAVYTYKCRVAKLLRAEGNNNGATTDGVAAHDGGHS